MYCASCGYEIDNGVKYCPECGHEIGTDPTESSTDSDGKNDVDNSSSIDSGADYDIAMSVEDGLRRRTLTRLVLDIIAVFATAGFWTGWVAFELISHHYNLKKGKTQPFEKGDEKEFNIL